MRRIARTVAASIVVILGLALVSLAAIGSEPPTAKEAAEAAQGPKADKADSIQPLDPNVGNGPARKIDVAGTAYIFQSEFGQRGKHDVEVVVAGAGQYAINWRDDPEAQWGAGSAQHSRTIDSGFPVVRVTVNGGGAGSSCVITVDGVEKDRQSTSADEPIVACEA